MGHFKKLFVDQLEDMYSSEKQIISTLPKLIQSASLPKLKEALSNHLKETRQQVSRLEKIFNLLHMKPASKQCKAMEGILREGDEMIKHEPRSSVCDAAIIAAAQKVEHYEIASYGTLRSFARFLELNDEVVDLLQEILDEEGHADRTLSRIAEGSFFTSSVNQEAAKMSIEEDMKKNRQTVKAARHSTRQPARSSSTATKNRSTAKKTNNNSSQARKKSR